MEYSGKCPDYTISYCFIAVENLLHSNAYYATHCCRERHVCRSFSSRGRERTLDYIAQRAFAREISLLHEGHWQILATIRPLRPCGGVLPDWDRDRRPCRGALPTTHGLPPSTRPGSRSRQNLLPLPSHASQCIRA